MSQFVVCDTSLTVWNIHPVITNDDFRQLLVSLGAKNVTMSNHRRQKSAIAHFSDEKTAFCVLSSLHQLKLAGRRLVVLLCDNSPESPPSENTANGSAQHDDHNVDAEQCKWMVHYMSRCAIPSPCLRYSYPPPSAAIVARISSHLYLSRRFYTQVLHLMNKLSLPAPFSADSLTASSVAASTYAASQHESMPDEGLLEESERRDLSANWRSIGTQTDAIELSSDEGSELEDSDQEEGGAVNTKYARMSVCDKVAVGSSLSDRHRRFVRSAMRQARGRTSIKRPASASMAPVPSVKARVSITPITQLPAAATPASISEHTAERLSVGFPLIGSPASRCNSDATSAVNNSDVETVSDNAGLDFITDQQLAENRLSDKDMQILSAFANYSRGNPSSRLYIKNISKRVEQRDLMKIYGRYIDWNNQLHTNSFDVRLMQQGRMKGQAFITLPSCELAERALTDTHGVIVHDKALVVQYARSAVANSSNNTS